MIATKLLLENQIIFIRCFEVCYILFKTTVRVNVVRLGFKSHFFHERYKVSHKCRFTIRLRTLCIEYLSNLKAKTDIFFLKMRV